MSTPGFDATATVAAVHRNRLHALGKLETDRIHLLVGLGVEADAHMGATIQHQSRVRRDPNEPNLRQVHLVAGELHDELRDRGFSVLPGAMGENITTRGLNLLTLPVGARLHLGARAMVEITGLRNPCRQLDGLAPGLMAAVLDHDEAGGLVRNAGIMAIVLVGGDVRRGDRITTTYPDPPHRPLGPV